MKNTVSAIARIKIEEVKRLTRSKIVRNMIADLLLNARVKTARYSGYSIDDRTDEVLFICEQIGLKVRQYNDAPKGGKIGNGVETNDDNFLARMIAVNNRRHNVKEFREIRIEMENENRRQNKITELTEYLENNKGFRDMLNERIDTQSSKNWRNWVRMKVAGAIGGWDLTPADIRDIVKVSLIESL